MSDLFLGKAVTSASAWRLPHVLPEPTAVQQVNLVFDGVPAEVRRMGWT